ncbi:MAG TPA: hypothetical protein VG126_12945 [Thermoleophilaceae bacterium]|nr:hypothetical protein [Thermoleophilaceae bacterium]
MRGPDPRNRARREIVAGIIGAEAGAGIGLLVMGGTPLAPIGLAAVGAALGAAVMSLRHALIRRWLRSQLRAAR